MVSPTMARSRGKQDVYCFYLYIYIYIYLGISLTCMYEIDWC